MKLLPRTLSVGCFVACASLFGACKRSDKPAEAPVLNDDLARAALGTYAELAHAMYSDSAELAQKLHARIELLVAQPSTETLKGAQEAWLAARVPYVQSEVFRFYDGPIDDVELLVNTWPIDEGFVDSHDPAAPPGMIQDKERHPELSLDLLTRLNANQSETSISTGYHVIEFLLWGRDTRADGPGERPYGDFVARTPDSVEARRGQYLLLTAELLVSHLQQVAEAWRAAAPDNYRAQLLSLSPRQALGRVLKGMGSLSGPELAGERLTVAYETKDQENEHSCFSDSTHLDMVGNAQGVQNVCLGRYRSPRGRPVSGTGVCALVEAVDPALGAKLKAQISASVQAARTIPAPFDQAILGSDMAAGRKAILRTIRSLEGQTASLAQAAKALHVDLGLAGARAEAP